MAANGRPTEYEYGEMVILGPWTGCCSYDIITGQASSCFAFTWCVWDGLWVVVVGVTTG